MITRFTMVYQQTEEKLEKHFIFNFSDDAQVAPMIWGGYASDGCIVGIISGRVWTWGKRVEATLLGSIWVYQQKGHFANKTQVHCKTKKDSGGWVTLRDSWSERTPDIAKQVQMVKLHKWNWGNLSAFGYRFWCVLHQLIRWRKGAGSPGLCHSAVCLANDCCNLPDTMVSG